MNTTTTKQMTEADYDRLLAAWEAVSCNPEDEAVMQVALDAEAEIGARMGWKP